TKAMISGALSSARATAIKEQHYAGIRFQKAYDPKGQLKAPQYMIFIIHDAKIKLGKQGNLSCRAVEGIEPIKLPEAVGVMDLKYGDAPIDGDDDIDDPNELRDTTTFSILFSPSGKLIIHNLWVRNRDGVNNNNSMDDVFNSLTNVKDNKIGMFLQDESSGDLRRELSRNSFIIYDRGKFRAAFERGRAWTDYLENLDAIYINPYVGTIIER
ncbi:unnamed protein product, partial [marine sediment metagenome]